MAPMPRMKEPWSHVTHADPSGHCKCLGHSQVFLTQSQIPLVLLIAHLYLSSRSPCGSKEPSPSTLSAVHKVLSF